MAFLVRGRRLKEAEETMAALTERQKALFKIVQEKNERIDELEAFVSEQSAQITKLQEEITRLLADREALRERIEQRNCRLRAARERVSRAERKLHELRLLGQQKRDLEQDISHLENVRDGLQEQLRVHEGMKETLLAQMHEILHDMFSGVVRDREADLDARLNEKRRQIKDLEERIGAVDRLDLLLRKIGAAQLQLKGLEGRVAATTTLVAIREQIAALKEEQRDREENVAELRSKGEELQRRIAGLRQRAECAEALLAQGRSALAGDMLSQEQVDGVLVDDGHVPDVNE